MWWSATLSTLWQGSSSSLWLGAVASVFADNGAAVDVDLGWYAPAQTQVNNLTAVLGGEGVYGFVFNSSETLDEAYGRYNWCNMPHVRPREYAVAGRAYELVYVELVHRHHKRTPYASNAFPVEPYHWDCDDEGLFYHAQPFTTATGTGKDNTQKVATPAYWKGYTSPTNPFVPAGWLGSCQFPQITAAGLDDSWQHGVDLYAVYHDLLGFLPGREDTEEEWRTKVKYRVTTNSITSQVAGMVVHGMWRSTTGVPLAVQAAAVDSLEPKYPCAASGSLFDGIRRGEAWVGHLEAEGVRGLYAVLDDISGVRPDDGGFHASFDHYYDNLSARQCHGKALPCKLINGVESGEECITQGLADEVYRLGQWEYSRLYRDERESLAASAASFGVWVAELAGHLRGVVQGDGDGTLWWHNIAHDGSVSRLLSVLQVEVMVWPGMGSEVVFELFRKRGRDGGGYYVRVLFGGKVMRSSNPSLGVMDMLPVETLLAYFDGLVGKGADLVIGRCNGAV
ncbi:histidine acid phosphatase [Bombardia bombarda]|uniref:Histidine acid phosphatase n=1 Tax=Bombardia bombarda TaxID=252184 RepID=A0AA40CDS5_9PEZI|nr:histidine acid phosphatase [Bombardia bombarda]